VFNDCKSALKFLECGVVSVPVLASPRAEFRELIRDGQNGFLAADAPESWYSKLVQLRDRPELLSVAAKGALESVLLEHTVASKGGQLAGYLSRLLSDGRVGVNR